MFGRFGLLDSGVFFSPATPVLPTTVLPPVPPAFYTHTPPHHHCSPPLPAHHHHHHTYTPPHLQHTCLPLRSPALHSATLSPTTCYYWTFYLPFLFLHHHLPYILPATTATTHTPFYHHLPGRFLPHLLLSYFPTPFRFGSRYTPATRRACTTHTHWVISTRHHHLRFYLPLHHRSACFPTTCHHHYCLPLHCLTTCLPPPPPPTHTHTPILILQLNTTCYATCLRSAYHTFGWVWFTPPFYTTVCVFTAYRLFLFLPTLPVYLYFLGLPHYHTYHHLSTIPLLLLHTTSHHLPPTTWHFCFVTFYLYLPLCRFWAQAVSAALCLLLREEEILMKEGRRGEEIIMGREGEGRGNGK